MKSATILQKIQMGKSKLEFGKRYNWEEANILITKITANVIVTSLLRTFRPSSGAIFNAQ